MISKRTRHTARPQEVLRQLALNTSKGVDNSKPPTDVNTVFNSRNLIVNEDGSVSLRKTLQRVLGSRCESEVTQHYLYDRTSMLRLEGNSLSVINPSGTSSPLRLISRTYTGAKIVSDNVTSMPITVPSGDLDIVNLNSATVLGNCELNLGALFNSDKMLDPDLWNDGVDLNTKTVPRYIQLVKGTDGVWECTIVVPEPNTLTSAEGEIPFNPNMTLDVPQAIRDEYNATLPDIKGIVAYTKSSLDSTNSPQPVDINSKSVSGGTFTIDLDVDLALDLDTAQGSSVTHEVPVTLDGVPLYVTVTSTCSGSGPTITVFPTITIQSTKSPLSLKGTQYANIVCNAFLTAPGLGTSISSAHIDMSPEKPQKWVASGIELTGSGELANVVGGNNVKVSIHIELSIDLSIPTVANNFRILQLTESGRDLRYRMATALSKNVASDTYLKAFCKLPKKGTFYATWLQSADGIHWEELNTFLRTDFIHVRELSDEYTPDRYVDKDTQMDATYRTLRYYPFGAGDLLERDDVKSSRTVDGKMCFDLNNRIDAVPIHCSSDGKASSMMYRLKVIIADPITKDDVEHSVFINREEYRVRATVAQQDFEAVFKDSFEFFDIEFGNAVYGKKLYYKKALYSYGYEKFFNNIFVSDIDSFITPLYNIIDLDTYKESRATCIIPWRDYLVSATPNAVYLHSKVDSGFLTKTVNTSIGVPEDDSKCCKAILNGVLFKSGHKVYQLYPNVYSGNDSTLNLTEISKPVEEILEGYTPGAYKPFAFSTDSEYILMLPESDSFATVCLRYNYSSKLWTVCEYPIIATRYDMLSINDIRLFGITEDASAEYMFDVEPSGDAYADRIYRGTGEVDVPISFEWDTGQKTDDISTTKQFVESKLVFATEDPLESLPLNLTIHVDGDPHVTTLDLNSDAPFWKTEDSVGVANTSLTLGDQSDSRSRILRQLIVRYSGKGKSVRHILSGKPTRNFRLYETYIRYKLLNVKR